MNEGIRNGKSGDHQRITAHKAWVLELPAGVKRCVHAYADDVLQSSEFRCRRRAQTETAADRTQLFVDCLGTVQIQAAGRLAATSAGPGHAVRLA